MNRPWQGQVNDRIIERLRQKLPNAVLRTTLIVGFPGETDDHFEHLLAFLQRHQFDHVGAFTFSSEEGTAAYDLPNHLPQAVMVERRDRLMALQQGISFRRNRAEVGRIVPVLLEQENPNTGEFIGRSPRFAPEVDGQVYVRGNGRLSSLVAVRITAAEPYDLFGEIVETLPPDFSWQDKLSSLTV